MTEFRNVEALVNGQATRDGAGVKLLRVLAGRWQQRLDPFLMLDEFASDSSDDYSAGFPAHPHRGFETVTYMLAGRMQHEDSAGHRGELGPGGVQWMTAGDGIVHSEMPLQESGRMHGFQLWINLPASHKRCPPAYQEFTGDAIPQLLLADGVTARLIAGTVQNSAGEPVSGPVRQPLTQPFYLDVQLAAGAEIQLPLPVGHHAFAYVYAGHASIGGSAVAAQQMAVLSNEGAQVHIRSALGCRVLLLAGKPLNEAIVQWGPFVMNSREDIEETLALYRQGLLGQAA